MTPAARVQTAAELLDRIFSGVPAEKALTGWARASRYAGSKDRAAVRDHVYDALRRRRSALPTRLEESGRSVMLGMLAQDGADLEAVFSGVGHGPAPLTEVEREALAEGFGALVDLPEWIIPRFQSVLGDASDQVFQGLRQRAPVFLRVNRRKASVCEAQAVLRNDGIETVSSDIAQTALRVTEGPRRIAQSKAYREGLVELQDVSSQAAVGLLDIPAGARVLDYCAGGGGKILAIAAQAEGVFFAHDIEAQRMRDLPERARRAGVQVTLLEGDNCLNFAPYNIVFTDVPCSGSGTWRRAPDAKWRFQAEDLEALLSVQARILRKAAGLVAEGGQLVYATCSFLREENEAQVEAFMAETPGWDIIQQARWGADTQSDGFFLTVLKRPGT